MPGFSELPGRSGIVTLFTQCLRRTDQPARDLPILLPLGPNGSGKTWLLRYLRDACRSSVAIPYVHLDCAAEELDAVWRLIGRLADRLSKRWPEFGRLDFPRLTLGRLAVSDKMPDDPDAAREWLLEELRKLARLVHVGQAAGEALPSVAEIFDIRPDVANLLGRLVARATTMRVWVDLVFHTGLAWHAARNDGEGGGIEALVELNRLFRKDPAKAQLVLLKAFLADLEAAYSAGRRSHNCAVLLDNCDDPVSRQFLELLAAERAATGRCDPLVIVAATGIMPESFGLHGRWLMPWDEERPARGEAARRKIPTPDDVGYDEWDSARRKKRTSETWWLPVRLRDLDVSELDHEQPDAHCRFVHRLTAGHPSSAHELLDAIPADLPLTDLTEAVREYIGRQAGRLLDGFSVQHRQIVRCWSAARHIDFASGVDLGIRVPGGASDLVGTLGDRLWLVEGSRNRGPRLHPWLRRLLLWELAERGRAAWDDVHGLMRKAAASSKWALDEAYHTLAVGDIVATVDHLGGRLGDLDADSWIREYDEVTAAPRIWSPESPADQYDELMGERDLVGQVDERRAAIWSLVAARWIWADPLGDPACTLTGTIADGFVKLADVAPTGRVRYHQEAQKYREMRP